LSGYLLDTNVLSELSRRAPAAAVRSWFDGIDEDTIFVSVLTLGEIKFGIARAAHAKRVRLRDWYRHLVARFGDRVLVIDRGVIDAWASLRARMSRPLPAIDSLIAATAIANELVVVTRNVADFGGMLDAVVDPWER
jgi:predicted nucleic acid-binding protein